MSIKVRLIIMNFLQFFVWGSWLISLGGYMGRELHFEGGQLGAIFATMGIASLVMPGIIGIIADKWFNAERLYGLCHIAGAGKSFWKNKSEQLYLSDTVRLRLILLSKHCCGRLQRKICLYFVDHCYCDHCHICAPENVYS